MFLFAIQEGFKEAAEKFRTESGLQPDMDLDSLDERIKIRDAIQNGRITEAISQVNNLHPELLDNDRYLYFHLQVYLKTTVDLVIFVRFYFLRVSRGGQIREFKNLAKIIIMITLLKKNEN